MPTGDYPTKIEDASFKVPSSNGMEIVKIDGLPKEDGWYWFTGKAAWTNSKEPNVLDFDEPIYWRCVPKYVHLPDEAHICAYLEFYIYESGEFWQIRKGE